MLRFWGKRCHMLRFLRSGEGDSKRCHMLRFSWIGGNKKKVSPVTVSRVWREEEKGVTCYGFWGLGLGRTKRCHMLRFLVFGEGGRKRCHMLRFLGFGGRGGKVSHVTVSEAWREREMVLLP